MHYKIETPQSFFSVSKQIEINKNQEQDILNQLSISITQNFPINFTKKCFTLYPFSNESFWAEALTTLKNTEVKRTDSLKIALLFGESNFLSMLPELLLKNTELVVLADIEPLLHRHTEHLLSCLTQANTPEDFISCYQINNPIAGVKDGEFIWDIQLLAEQFKSRGTISSLQGYYFLNSIERYNQCKEAASKLKFVHANVNILNSNRCLQFAAILKEHNASFSLCNFTNIHHYDKEFQLKQTIPLLLNDSPECFLMYAGVDIAFLDTNISQNIDDFFNLKKTYSYEIPIIEYDFDLNDSFAFSVS